MRQARLPERHVQAGARMLEFGGWHMPVARIAHAPFQQPPAGFGMIVIRKTPKAARIVGRPFFKSRNWR